MKKRIAVISDIHGNLEALEAILAELQILMPDSIVCLGDIIGYGPNPNECLQRLFSLDNIHFLRGNHEDIWIGKITLDQCSLLVRESAMWTMQTVDKKYESYIKEFKNSVSIDDYNFVHTPSLAGNEYPYLNTVVDILNSFQDTDLDIQFYGHTHRPRITEVKEWEVKDYLVTETLTIPLIKNVRYYINVGSVGQQRDNKTDASFAVIEVMDDVRLLTIKRVPYDSYSTYAKIKKVMRNSELANYLIREQERRKQYENTFNRS